MVNLYEELGSFRAVADIVGCDHKTVKAHALRNAERQPLQRSSVADPYRDVTRAKLDATSGKALHRLQAPGDTSIDDAHYPTPPPTGIRALRPVTATEREFLSLGPIAEAYLRAAAAAGASRLPRTLQDVLDLVRSHGRDQVLAALQRAVVFGRFGSEDLRSILAAGTATPPAQRPASTVLAVDGVPAVPTRSLEAYAWPA